jgi:catechol 2,3-dioxygenase-like lactoylglutathione lyase family enzyme
MRLSAAGHTSETNRMTSFVSHTTVDCRDAYRLSEWWKEVLGYRDVPGDPNEPGDEECMIVAVGEGPPLLFIEVPEVKSGKNRIHFDLRPCDGVTRDHELARLVQLGATERHDTRTPDGRGWVVLADPEGNEFCILRSQGELTAETGAAE